MAEPIRVRAVEGRLVQMLNDQGRVIPGVYVGRKSDTERTIIARGVMLPDLPQWRRLIADGDLELRKGPMPSDEDDAAASPSEPAKEPAPTAEAPAASDAPAESSTPTESTAKAEEQ